MPKPSILKNLPPRWADYPSDDEIVFKMEECIINNGKNKKTPVEQEEKQDSGVTKGDDPSPVRSENSKEKPIDIHRKIE